MRIGITEQGDASMDFSWVSAIRDKDVAGAVIITKCLTERVKEELLSLNKDGYKVILHVTCTGYGGTRLELGAYPYKDQINSLMDLIGSGFPAENCVLRIDPIFPTEKGLQRFREVLMCAKEKLLGYMHGDIDHESGTYHLTQKHPVHIRLSVFDEYPHVCERFKTAGFDSIYGGAFQADDEQLNRLLDIIEYEFGYLKFETCAERRLTQIAESRHIRNIVPSGCVGYETLKVLGITAPEMIENPQGRNGCLCLSCKKEILTKNGKKRCPIKCLYCYWKD